jgi:hypothetical protein
MTDTDYNFTWEDAIKHAERHTDFSNINRLDVSILQILMLHPNDEIKRDRSIASAIPEFFDDLQKNYQIELPQYLQECRFQFARAATPIKIIHEEVRSKEDKSFPHGMICGRYLYEAVLNNIYGVSITLDKLRAKCCEPFIEVGSQKKHEYHYPLSKQNFNTIIWPCYKSVAHFWAAAYEEGVFNSIVRDNQARLAELEAIQKSNQEIRQEQVALWQKIYNVKESGFRGSKATPCHEKRLEHFLGRAEWFKEKGENLRPKGSSKTMLIKGKAFKFPENWQRPAIDLPIYIEQRNIS